MVFFDIGHLVLLVILIVVICFIARGCKLTCNKREGLSDSCETLYNSYIKCLRAGGGETCGANFCQASSTCATGYGLDCESHAMPCKGIDISKTYPTCFNLDTNNGQFFDKCMTKSDVESVCKDEDTHREICDPMGTYVVNGKTPCCTMCDSLSK